MRIIDIHAHDGKFDHTEPNLYDYLGENMADFCSDLEKDNVSNCFISSITALLNKDVAYGNSVTFNDATFDDRLKAYVYYNPSRVNESINEINKYRNHHKFIGFKSRPSYHSISIDKTQYEPLLLAASSTQKPILLHCFHISDCEPVINAAKKYPSVNIIMAHACNDEYISACNLIKEYTNIYIEPVTSTVYPNKIRDIINIIGKERLLFGSDYGLLSRKKVIATYEEANLSSEEHELIFAKNAERIFKITNE